jgi:hypothetical protein
MPSNNDPSMTINDENIRVKTLTLTLPTIFISIESILLSFLFLFLDGSSFKKSKKEAVRS